MFKCLAAACEANANKGRSNSRVHSQSWRSRSDWPKIVTWIRNGQSTVGGPKWTKMGFFRPKWTILVHFGLANAKIRFGIRSFWPKWSFGPFWSSTLSDSTAATPFGRTSRLGVHLWKPFGARIPDCLSLLVVGKWLSKPPSTTNKPLISH